MCVRKHAFQAKTVTGRQSETAEDIICISAVEVGHSVKTKSSGSLVRYKHWARDSAYRHIERSVPYFAEPGGSLGIACAFFSPVFFAFQTDTRIYSVFHPLDEFQPATTAFASERDRQPSATSGIAPIAIASNYKRPSTSSSFLYNFYCTSSATLQNLFYYFFYCTYFPQYSRESAAPLSVVPPLLFATTSDHVREPSLCSLAVLYFGLSLMVGCWPALRDSMRGGKRVSFLSIFALVCNFS